jgi:hypothetical protein
MWRSAAEDSWRSAASGTAAPRSKRCAPASTTGPRAALASRSDTKPYGAIDKTPCLSAWRGRAFFAFQAPAPRMICDTQRFMNATELIYASGRSAAVPGPRRVMRVSARVLLALVLCLASVLLLRAQEAKPKLGPDAVSIERSHSYLRRHAAPDFWRLGPYYVPQATGSGCSLAAITMLVNALRGLPAHNDDPLATQEAVLQAVASEAWARQTAENGSGVTFAELVRYLHLSLEAFDLDAEIDVLKPGDNLPATLEKLRRSLAANERTDRDIVLVYFNQGVLTGAWDGPHISPIGAYDAARRRVLIMDVDRQWYIPYWASDEKLLAAMLRPAPSRGPLAGETGGLVRAILKSAARR